MLLLQTISASMLHTFSTNSSVTHSHKKCWTLLKCLSIDMLHLLESAGTWLVINNGTISDFISVNIELLVTQAIRRYRFALLFIYSVKPINRNNLATCFHGRLTIQKRLFFLKLISDTRESVEDNNYSLALLIFLKKNLSYVEVRYRKMLSSA